MKRRTRAEHAVTATRWRAPRSNAEDRAAPDDGSASARRSGFGPALSTEMLRFYDQLRRQSQRLERFHELIEETLGGGGAGDRGTDRLLAQTRS